VPRRLQSALLLTSIFLFVRDAGSVPPPAPSRVYLHDNWALQSSCKLSAPTPTGAAISTPGFNAQSWHRATIPSTVVAALVADGTYPDPYFSDNLRSLPGADYPAGQDFALIPMPVDSPFACSWWYRTEFTLPTQSNRHQELHLDGINNRANVWLNGHPIADAQSVAGAYRTYAFDISNTLRSNAPNALAVEVFAQTPDDLGITWIDWNPAPPDKNMGLWRDVYIDSSGPVAIRNPQVITHFPSEDSLDAADLTVETQLHNFTAQPITGKLAGTIDANGAAFQQQITLAANETRTVRFAAADFPELHLHNPKLWWPAQMGDPALHDLHLRFTIGSSVSDEQALRFGIREVTSSLDANGNRLFRINGKKIFIRGAGWTPDMLLRESPDRLRTELRYVRDLNLSTIRLEGKLESDEFYELTDQMGILVMPGWSCCDRWQDAANWRPQDLQVATESLRSQLLRLRAHPSVFVWLSGSDTGPPPNVEEAYIATLKEEDWPDPYLFSAAEDPSTITGPTGVKMTGPYDYVPPDFWLADSGANGGADGFNMETSPGPAIPLKSSLQRMFGADHLAPDDPSWAFHNAVGTFGSLDHFNETMRAVYGPPTDLDDYERKAQAMSYDSERAMFEAYSRNKYSSTTGIIQWMLNNAWPSLFWHLYDYYLQPAAGYFGVKKALEPLHVQYSYDDRSIVVVNSTYTDAPALKVSATVYDFDLRQAFSQQALVDASSDSATRVLTIPESAVQGGSPIHLVSLTLTGPGGAIASSNFYPIPDRRNVFDWPNASFRFTPVSSYEDLTTLAKLPAATILAAARLQTGPTGPSIRVVIHNRSPNLAFLLTPQLAQSPSLPLWSDSYFSLLPGESREIVATDLPSEALTKGATITLTGWNISPLQVPIVHAK
jgi:exo-1,4-beta-D-glucosaminidase